MYGAFGVPVALLLWINFTSKLVLFCASWTATGHADSGPKQRDDEPDEPAEPGDFGEVSGGGASGRGGASGG
jgi:membrane protein